MAKRNGKTKTGWFAGEFAKAENRWQQTTISLIAVTLKLSRAQPTVLNIIPSQKIPCRGEDFPAVDVRPPGDWFSAVLTGAV